LPLPPAVPCDGTARPSRVRVAANARAELLKLIERGEPERKEKLPAVLHEELAAVAQHVDVAQVEQRLVDRL
jgi:hypothetical protein